MACCLKLLAELARARSNASMKRQREGTAEAEASHGQSRQALRRCGTPLQVDELEPQADLGAGVAGCEGFTVLRSGLLLDAVADAAAVVSEHG